MHNFAGDFMDSINELQNKFKIGLAFLGQCAIMNSTIGNVTDNVYGKASVTVNDVFL